jgi:NTE family protein
VSGAPVAPGKRPHPSAFAALMASSQIMQRTIVREKLKVRQPDIYIDVEVDDYYVLDFYRFKQILADAAPAQAQLRRQLERVLASQAAETLPAIAARNRPPRAASPQRAAAAELQRLSPARKT